MKYLFLYIPEIDKFRESKCKTVPGTERRENGKVFNGHRVWEVEDTSGEL
jgi:hypothetical protein